MFQENPLFFSLRTVVEMPKKYNLNSMRLCQYLCPSKSPISSGNRERLPLRNSKFIPFGKGIYIYIYILNPFRDMKSYSKVPGKHTFWKRILTDSLVHFDLWVYWRRKHPWLPEISNLELQCMMCMLHDSKLSWQFTSLERTWFAKRARLLQRFCDVKVVTEND